jgi:hypothetical protein
MQQTNVENIYKNIVLLSDLERDELYNRIRRDFYENKEIIAYTTSGEALNMEQYKKRIHAGIEQCMNGESITFEESVKDLGYNYDEL